MLNRILDIISILTFALLIAGFFAAILFIIHHAEFFLLTAAALVLVGAIGVGVSKAALTMKNKQSNRVYSV